MSARAAFVLVLIAGCGAPPPAPSPPPPEPDTPLLTKVSGGSVNGELPTLPPAPPITLTAGDLLRVVVFRHKDLELAARVPESGSFAYPLIGEVQAVGRTTKQVEADIRSRLAAKYLRNPSVTVTVDEFAERSVYVLGGVLKPSGYPYPLARRFTVLQLVSTAGGFTDRALKEYAQLLRRRENGERELVRFSIAEVERQVARGNAAADLELAPDDLLVIPSAARVVYVLGQVNKPGAFDLPADTRVTVSMAVSQAGSWTKYGAISRVQVLRQPPTGEAVKMAVDLDAVVNGAIDRDLELQAGDVVWVPQRTLF